MDMAERGRQERRRNPRVPTSVRSVVTDERLFQLQLLSSNLPLHPSHAIRTSCIKISRLRALENFNREEASYSSHRQCPKARIPHLVSPFREVEQGTLFQTRHEVLSIQSYLWAKETTLELCFGQGLATHKTEIIESEESDVPFFHAGCCNCSSRSHGIGDLLLARARWNNCMPSN